MKRLGLLIILAVGACGSDSPTLICPGDPGCPLAAFRATWGIDDEFGTPISCAQVPADTVTFDFVGRSTGDRPVFIFDCAAGNGATVTSDVDVLIGEVYDVNVTLSCDQSCGPSQVVGTVDFVVTPQTPVFNFPAILFALQ